MYSKTTMKQRVLLKGADAVDLMNRISTADLGRLSLGVPTLSLFLNPQGKILCAFELTKIDDQSFEAVFDGPFLDVLDRYTFAEKYTVTRLDPIEDPGSSDRERILALEPKLGFEFQNDGNTNPLEINLLKAIHENKGCYPGQEVIEKIISLGSPARKLALVEGSSSDLLPATVFDAESNQEAGTLTSFSDGVGLAILKRTHQKPGAKLKTQAGNFEVVKLQP